MLWGVVLAVAVVGGSGQAKKVPAEVAQLYRQYPDAHFSALFKESLEAFVKADEAYRGGRYGVAKQVLDGFWEKRPAGAALWVEGYREAAEGTARRGVNVGHPACYYALRMLTECVEWRTSGKKPAGGPMTATMTVVLVGGTKGVEPRTREELEAGKGVEVAHVLDRRLLAEDHKVIRESTWLFTEYVKAATKGELEVKVDYVHLPKLVAPVSVTWDTRGHAGLAGGAWGPIWDAVPEDKRRGTDWWWVLYPSAVPDGRADFATTEFVTGGMGSGPDGRSPCFIIDDKWLVRKPPHLGRGDYSSLERRAYLPQWFQHEFFHHLFRIYPELGLEKTGHDWFDRRTWPSDFVGVLEPDYYAEALRRRFIGSTPSLAQRLLYAAPPLSLLSQVRVEDLVGEYVREPEENGWHRGRIVSVDGGLRWVNEAGVSWGLEFLNGSPHPALPLGRGRVPTLRVGEDCPYYAEGAREFSLVLERDERGRHVGKVRGFGFMGGEYGRVGF